MPPNISYLPQRGTPEADELIAQYPTASDEQVKAWAKQYGFKSKPAFMGSMLKRLDVKRAPAVLPAEQELASGLSPVEQRILHIVQQGRITVGEISRQVDRSRETVIATIDSLREKGYEIVLDEASRQISIPQEPGKEFKPTEFKYFKRFYRIGLVGDTHLCSKYQQLTLLHDAYSILNQRGVDFVLHAGDLVDGRDVYRGQKEETFLYGADEQKDYVITNYPKLERGRKTYIIGGQHDRSFFKNEGYNIIRAICQERRDLIYRGFYKAQFLVKGLEIGLQHPGGGVAYAHSYKIQKIVEGMMGFIASIPGASKPVLQVFGHWHIACHLPYYMGIDAISLPCFQSQTPYLEQLGKMPVVGFAIAELQLDKNNNLSSTKIEFIILNSQIRKGDF